MDRRDGAIPKVTLRAEWDNGPEVTLTNRVVTLDDALELVTRFRRGAGWNFEGDVGIVDVWRADRLAEKEDRDG